MQTIMEKGTDRELRDAVLGQLEWEPQVQSQDISVRAKEGTVALTGFVRSYAEKFAAERVAKSVYGVRAIANDIEVKPATRTDPEIARDVVDAMRIDVRVPDERIKATVRDGFVTLEGAAEWNFQREAAEGRARHVHGVLGVANRIEVKSRVASTTNVKSRIEEALRRSAELDARRISVSLQDGAVMLDGNVHTWFEREEAERAAWAAPGISRVVDNITVVP
jgi:osmotically-inducible protein OsmY